MGGGAGVLNEGVYMAPCSSQAIESIVSNTYNSIGHMKNHGY